MHCAIRYLLNLLVALDQLANSLLAGDPDETISSRLGRIKRAHGGQVPLSRPVAKALDTCLNILDPGHSLSSIEPDEGSNGLVDIPKNDPPILPQDRPKKTLP